MNRFFRSNKKMIPIVAAAAVVVIIAIIFFALRSGNKNDVPADDPNAVTGGAEGDFSQYAVGQEDREDEWPEGIIDISDGDDYNVMLSDLGLLSDEGSLSAVGGAQKPAKGIDPSTVQKDEGTATILIYCMGSQLETESGCATADLREMIASGIGKARKVNVIIETGGAKKWWNPAVSASKLQRFRIMRDGLYPLWEDASKSMADPTTLQDFITWGVQNYPAERVGLIIWGKGGGNPAGAGYDELYGEALSLTGLDTALTAAGFHFEFVGFDASLMGTLETAYMLSKHAGYMIASEGTEPGGGWYYTGWMKLLSTDPRIDIESMSKQLADDTINYSGTCGEAVSLSAVRLDLVPYLYSQLCSFLVNAKNAVAGEGFAGFSKAVHDSVSFGSYEQRDIAGLAAGSGIEGADALIAAIDGAVIYHNSNIKDICGLAMYFPYEEPSLYARMSDMNAKLGMNDPACSDFFNVFLDKINASGKDAGAMGVFAGSNLKAVEKDENDYYAIELTPEQLREIVHADAELYIDDGQGYIDMGCDDLCENDKDGNIMLDFDNTWISVEGQPVCLAARTEGVFADQSSYTCSIVKAELTDADGVKKDIEMIIQWDEYHSEGYVKGYRRAAAGDDATVDQTQHERALMQFNDGDRIRFVYDYHTYMGEYKPAYRFSDEIMVSEELEISYEEIDDLKAEVAFRLVDIYNNEYRSDRIKY